MTTLPPLTRSPVNSDNEDDTEEEKDEDNFKYVRNLSSFSAPTSSIFLYDAVWITSKFDSSTITNVLKNVSVGGIVYQKCSLDTQDALIQSISKSDTSLTVEAATFQGYSLNPIYFAKVTKSGDLTYRNGLRYIMVAPHSSTWAKEPHEHRNLIWDESLLIFEGSKLVFDTSHKNGQLDHRESPSSALPPKLYLSNLKKIDDGQNTYVYEVDEFGNDNVVVNVFAEDAWDILNSNSQTAHFQTPTSNSKVFAMHDLSIDASDFYFYWMRGENGEKCKDLQYPFVQKWFDKRPEEMSLPAAHGADIFTLCGIRNSLSLLPLKLVAGTTSRGGITFKDFLAQVSQGDDDAFRTEVMSAKKVLHGIDSTRNSLEAVKAKDFLMANLNYYLSRY